MFQLYQLKLRWTYVIYTILSLTSYSWIFSNSFLFISFIYLYPQLDTGYQSPVSLHRYLWGGKELSYSGLEKYSCVQYYVWLQL